MDKSYLRLSVKLDLILKQQEAILKHLQISLVDSELPKTSSKKELTKKQEEEKFQNELRQVILNSHRLKEQFNLTVTPQSHRVLAYLRTGDSSAFDGL